MAGSLRISNPAGGRKNLKNIVQKPLILTLISISDRLVADLFLFYGRRSLYDIGICAQSAMTYSPTGSGCAVTYDSISTNVSNLRSGKSHSVNFTNDQREAAIS